MARSGHCSHLAFVTIETVTLEYWPATRGLSGHAWLSTNAILQLFGADRTDKIENQIFLIHKEIQNGAVAKSYMNNDILIFAHFLIYILGSPSS
jgi:hypothetical protein